MRPTARAIAENASFQTFANCYLREIDGGRWHTLPSCDSPIRMERNWAERQPGMVELLLPSQRARLVLDVIYRSAIGRHRIGGARMQRQGETGWYKVDPFSAIQLLAAELYLSCADMPAELCKIREAELLYRIVESYQVMARYIEARRDDSALLGSRFIESEQSLLQGHWAHPTPKSRQGMVDWAHDCYAPELRGSFPLHVFAVDRSLLVQNSALDVSAETVLRECLELTAPEGSVPVPVHPLQAQWLLQRDPVREAMAAGLIRDLGPQGPAFTATSSVRTVYHPNLAWMLKLSIPVKITNSRRINLHHELEAGVVMARLLARTGFCCHQPRFQVIADPAYLSVRLPGLRESGFEVILRNNPFTDEHDHGVHCIAALTQDPLPHHRSRLYTLIEGLALAEGRREAAVSRDWFRQYWDCAIEPALRLLDEHGIALEAHQQNSLLDVSAGYPRTYYYRDNQGYYLSPSYRAHLISLEPRLAEVPALFFDDAMIRDRFTYYLFFNQLFAVVYRFGADGLIDERALLDWVRQRLQTLTEQLSGAGLALVVNLLQSASLAYKGNLLTRLRDLDELTADQELAVYTRIPNPLVLSANAHSNGAADADGSQEADYEVA